MTFPPSAIRFWVITFDGFNLRYYKQHAIMHLQRTE